MSRPKHRLERIGLLALGLVAMTWSTGCPKGVASKVDQSQPPVKVVAAAVQAKEALLALQFEEAALKQASVLSAEARSQLHANLGAAHDASGNYPKAFEHYSLALQAAPAPTTPASTQARNQLFSDRASALWAAGSFQAAANAFGDWLRDSGARKDASGQQLAALMLWRMADLAGDPNLGQVETMIEGLGPSSPITRRMKLEKRRGLPAHPVPVVGGLGDLVYVDPRGRPLTEAYESADPFRDGYAIVKSGGKYGLLDKRLRMVIPPRYDSLYWVSHRRERLEARLTPTRGVSRYALLAKTGQAIVPFGPWSEIENGETAVAWVTERVPGKPVKGKDGKLTPSAPTTRMRYFRTADGTETTAEAAEEARREYQHTKSRYAPYRTERRKLGSMERRVLVDRSGKQVFPPAKLPAADVAQYTDVLRVSDEVVLFAFHSKTRGAVLNEVRGLWDLRTGKPLVPLKDKLYDAGPFVGGRALVARDATHVGVLGRDGTWILEPEVTIDAPFSHLDLQLRDPVAIPGRPKHHRQAVHVGLDGKPLYDARFAGTYPYQWDHARASVEVPPGPDLGLNHPYGFSSALVDRRGQLVWPAGRVRLMDNEASIFLPERWHLMQWDMGKAFFKLGPEETNGRFRIYPRKPNEAFYDVQGIMAVHVLQRFPGQDQAQLNGLVGQLAPGAATTKIGDHPVGKRSFQLFRSQGKAGAQDMVVVTGALWASKAYYLSFNGPLKHEALVKARLTAALDGLRFPGDPGF